MGWSLEACLDTIQWQASRDVHAIHLLREAALYAQRFSTDPSTQNGALLVTPDWDIVAYGANHFPRGVAESPARWERPIKYQFVEHAERGVIYTAARNGIKTAGLIMVCPWFACPDCSRAIIEARIAGVIGLNVQGSAPHWEGPVKIGRGMLKEAGVWTHMVDGPIGVKLRLNGVEAEQ